MRSSPRVSEIEANDVKRSVVKERLEQQYTTQLVIGMSEQKKRILNDTRYSFLLNLQAFLKDRQQSDDRKETDFVY